MERLGYPIQGHLEMTQKIGLASVHRKAAPGIARFGHVILPMYRAGSYIRASEDALDRESEDIYDVTRPLAMWTPDGPGSKIEWTALIKTITLIAQRVRDRPLTPQRAVALGALCEARYLAAWEAAGRERAKQGTIDEEFPW